MVTNWNTPCMSVIYFTEYKEHITFLFWMILVHKTFNSSESTEEQTYMVQSS